MKNTILIVDDHPLLLRGIRQLLQQEQALEVLGQAATGSEAVRLAKELRPNIVVMDHHLPDISGVQATTQILQSLPHCKVIVLSGDANRALVDAALQAGACGYLYKQSVETELLAAIKFVLNGRLYLSPEISSLVLDDYRHSLSGDPGADKQLLTAREKSLVKLVADGKRNKEIAAELGLSPNSIETYRARLMKKLGCASTAELVKYAIREGIASPD